MNGGLNVVIEVCDTNDFQRILESPIFIGCDKMSLDKETSTNMWAISIAPRMLKNISIDYLLEFIRILLANKVKQLSLSKISCPVIFYMWFDEMTAQLRFNIISNLDHKLPFGCHLNITDSTHLILKNFLQSQYNPEIPWTDLEEITNDPANDDDFDDTRKNNFVLDVFVKQLNSPELE